MAEFLVMFMQAGFALAETGFCRAKNATHTMAMNYLFISSMLALVAFGFIRLYSTGEIMPTPASEDLHFDRSVGTTPHGLLTLGTLLWLLLRGVCGRMHSLDRRGSDLQWDSSLREAGIAERR